MQMERWLSGRKRTTRNRLIDKTIRGFESHPLRLNSYPKEHIRTEKFFFSGVLDHKYSNFVLT